MKKFVLPISAIIVLVLIGIGCTPLTSVESITPTVEVVPGVEVTETAVPYPEADEGTPAIRLIPGEGTRPYPSLDDRPIDMLPTPEIGGPEAVKVIQSEQVVWSDGSLGCPRPGEMYTQALVDGYRVVLEQSGETYDYRVANTGYFFLCENSLNLGVPPKTVGTPTE